MRDTRSENSLEVHAGEQTTDSEAHAGRFAGEVVVETDQSTEFGECVITGIGPELGGIDGAGSQCAAAKACLNPEQADRVSEGDYVHLLGRRITVPGDVAVVNPLPGSPWAEPDATLESMLTLTTCHPLYSNSERLIVHAVLVETIPKISGNNPAALQEQ